MEPSENHEVIELLESLYLEGETLIWPTETYRYWIDRLSKIQDNERITIAKELVTIAYQIKNEIPSGSKDIITKLYTCISLLKRGFEDEFQESVDSQELQNVEKTPNDSSANTDSTGLFDESDDASKLVDSKSNTGHLLEWFKCRQSEDTVQHEYKDYEDFTDMFEEE